MTLRAARSQPLELAGLLAAVGAAWSVTADRMSEWTPGPAPISANRAAIDLRLHRVTLGGTPSRWKAHPRAAS